MKKVLSKCAELVASSKVALFRAVDSEDIACIYQQQSIPRRKVSQQWSSSPSIFVCGFYFHFHFYTQRNASPCNDQQDSQAHLLALLTMHFHFDTSVRLVLMQILATTKVPRVLLHKHLQRSYGPYASKHLYRETPAPLPSDSWDPTVSEQGLYTDETVSSLFGPRQIEWRASNSLGKRRHTRRGCVCGQRRLCTPNNSRHMSACVWGSADIERKKGREATENVRLAIILGFDAAPPAAKLPARGLWHRRGAECAESARLL